MATEQGRETRIFIKTGDNTKVKIGGETTFSYKRNTPSIDTADKDGGSGSFGQATINISTSGNVKLPDAGLVALDVASKATPPHIEIEIMKGEVTRFAGLVAVGNFSADFPLGTATWSAEMVNAAVPTTDNLTATA